MRFGGGRNHHSVSTKASGMAAGADVSPSRNLRFGMLGAWERAGSTTADAPASIAAETYNVAAYAGYALGRFQFTGTLGFGTSDFDGNRRITAGPLVRHATSSYGGDIYFARAEAAYRMGFDSVSITPLVAVHWGRADIDGFAESGAGALSLMSRGRSIDFVDTTVGIRFASAFTSQYGTISPHARILWTHTSGDTDPAMRFGFVSGGETFGITGARGARNTLELGAGATFKQTDRIVGYIDAVTRLSSETTSVAGSAGLKIRF